MFVACTQICFSCTNMAENEKCTHAIACDDNEICFVQKYQTTGNITRYDVGCTFPEVCRKDIIGNMFGKRSDHSHVLCQKCCDEPVCNANLNLTCGHELKEQRQKCLSCSEVGDPDLCKNISICGKDEVCYLHEYTTELNQQQFDMGCKHSALCLHGYATDVFGRRLTMGRRLICESCCSGSDLCNKNLQCRHAELNSSCTSTADCYGNLVCFSSQCQCFSDYFWDKNKCMKKRSFNELCNQKDQCQQALQCTFNTCQCPNMGYWNGSFCTSQPIECEDLSIDKDGIYLIYPTTGLPVLVYCMIEGNKKWTVIQRRFSKSVDFSRTWYEYKTGFGSPYGEYWLGNENIHKISTNGHHEISIYMEQISSHRFANYSTFSIGNETSKYTLNITGYRGDAGDSMNSNEWFGDKANGQMFSTWDQDNDNITKENLAAQYRSGWWFGQVPYSDLNSNGQMFWVSYFGYIKKSVIKIRRS